MVEDAPVHPPTDECPDPECIECGARDCPYGEPFHYHHDGCPACWRDGIQFECELAA